MVVVKTNFTDFVGIATAGGVRQFFFLVLA
jgi:hypothetical protein